MKKKKNKKRKAFQKKIKLKKNFEKKIFKKSKPKKKKIKKRIKKSFFEKILIRIKDFFFRIFLKYKIYFEKIKSKYDKKAELRLKKLLSLEEKFRQQKLKEIERSRIELIKDLKQQERKKIYDLKDHLWKMGDRFQTIRERYKEYRQKIRDKELAELEIRKQSREEARAILEAQKAEHLLKQKLEERLDKYSRNMKSIVFQINKRYLAKKRSPLRFVNNIAESGECLIRNDDAPSDKDYLFLLFVEGEKVEDRLVNPINLDDKTDMTKSVNFQPKNIFQASDYIIDRLATMFENERKLKQ